MTSFMQDPESATASANIVKEMVVITLGRLGLFREGVDPNKVCQTFTVVLVKRGLLGQLWDRLRGREDDNYHFEVVVSPLSYESFTEPLRVRNVLVPNPSSIPFE